MFTGCPFICVCTCLRAPERSHFLTCRHLLLPLLPGFFSSLFSVAHWAIQIRLLLLLLFFTIPGSIDPRGYKRKITKTRLDWLCVDIIFSFILLLSLLLLLLFLPTTLLSADRLKRFFIDVHSIKFCNEIASGDCTRPIECHRAALALLAYLASGVQFIPDAGHPRLWSATERICVIPPTRSGFGNRSFSAVSPRVWSTLPSYLPTNSSMHRCECIALCKDIGLQRGRYRARSLASCIPRSSKDRSSWMFFIQVVLGCPGGRLQFSGGGSSRAWLATVFSSFRARCPKKVRRRETRRKL